MAQESTHRHLTRSRRAHAVSFDSLPPGAEQLCGAAWGGTPFGCRLGRSTVWVPPGAEHRLGAAWGGAPRHCSPLLASLPAIALVSIVSVAAVPTGAVRRVAADR